MKKQDKVIRILALALAVTTAWTQAPAVYAAEPSAEVFFEDGDEEEVTYEGEEMQTISFETDEPSQDDPADTEEGTDFSLDREEPRFTETNGAFRLSEEDYRDKQRLKDHNVAEILPTLI